MSDPQKKSATDWMAGYHSAFYAIGVAFVVLGAGAMFFEPVRGAGFAFFPIGLVFIILAMTSRKPEPKGDEPPRGPSEA